MIFARLFGSLALSASLALSLPLVGCKKDEPRKDPAPPANTMPMAGSGGANLGEVPSAEDFCTHIDSISQAELAQMPGTPEEKQQMITDGHAACVTASEHDRKAYPEWGPCARCAMSTTDLQAMEAKCDSVCKALGEKLDKKAALADAAAPN